MRAMTNRLSGGGFARLIGGLLLSLATSLAGADILYVHTDHLGTPRLATDEMGTVVWRNLPTTEPFGNSPVEEDPDGDATLTTLNPRFPGQYADKETNLNYNYFRDYDPSTGRYVQSDPIGLRGGINTYAYGGGSPLTNIDEDGLAYFAKRPLGNFSWLWLGTFSCNLGGWYDLLTCSPFSVPL